MPPVKISDLPVVKLDNIDNVVAIVIEGPRNELRRFTLRDVFTAADVTRLRDLAVEFEAEADTSESMFLEPQDGGPKPTVWRENAASCRARGRWASSLADRIAGLLSLSPK